MFFESLESRRLMSIVTSSGFLEGIKASQSSDGSLTINLDKDAYINIAEAGTHADLEPNPVTPVTHDGGGPGSIGLYTGTGYILFNNLNDSKPIKISASKGGFVNFAGLAHPAKITGAAGSLSVFLEEEGAGGTEVHCGNGSNYVGIVYSHHVTIHDGGGVNNFSINLAFHRGDGVAASSDGVTATDGHGRFVNVNGNTALDLITLDLGKGQNFIEAAAGNIKIMARGSDNILNIQAASTTQLPEYNPPSTFSTDWVHVDQIGIYRLWWFPATSITN